MSDSLPKADAGKLRCPNCAGCFWADQLEEHFREEFGTTEEKPETSSGPPPPGKFYCRLCGLAKRKSEFGAHCFTAHSDAAFRCLHCTYEAKAKKHLVSHQRRVHGVERSVALLNYRLDKPPLPEVVRECFGEPSESSYPVAYCLPCKKTVLRSSVRDHVATAHFQKVLHECLLCGWDSTAYRPQPLIRHLAKEHNDALPGPGTSVSRAQTHRVHIDGIAQRIFRETTQ